MATKLNQDLSQPQPSAGSAKTASRYEQTLSSHHKRLLQQRCITPTPHDQQHQRSNSKDPGSQRNKLSDSLNTRLSQSPVRHGDTHPVKSYAELLEQKHNKRFEFKHSKG